MSRSEVRTRERIAALADRLLPGTLWGHGYRGLIWNPIFALLPWYYLERFEASAWAPASACWLGAFLLGFPHAGYTALEIKHYFLPQDGIAVRQTRAQLALFSAYTLFGAGLSVWYIKRGASLLGERLGLDVHPLMAALALVGSVGTVLGLQDILVVDVVRRPLVVIRGAGRALLTARWRRLTVGLATGQFLLAAMVELW